MRICYTIANGGGRARGNKDGSGQRVRTWRTFVLSTGEHDIATAAAKAGQNLPAGADVRLPCIRLPGPQESWPTLHGHGTVEGLWDAIHAGMTGLPPGAGGFATKPAAK